MYLKISDGYSNKFITTIKGHVFKEGMVTEYDGGDLEVDNLLEQGLLVITEDKENLVKNTMVHNDMDKTNEEYKEMLKEDKRKAKEEIIKQFETEDDKPKVTETKIKAEDKKTNDKKD